MRENKRSGRVSAAAMGVVLLLALAAALLWVQNSRTMQAAMSVSLGVRFDGEYKIGDGQWQPIIEGKHIPATKGDVTLRGLFSLLDPFNGETIGPAGKGLGIAVYLNHIRCEIQEPGCESHTFDAEQPQFGVDACGQIWFAYVLQGEGEEAILLHFQNPHRFGNETAIDDFLSGVSIYQGTDFEKQMSDLYGSERTLGFVFLLAAFAAFGIALFSAGLQLPQGGFFWQVGFLNIFAGGFFLFSSPVISLQNWSIVSNTTILGLCMMLYMLFMTALTATQLKEEERRVGSWIVGAMGAVCGVCILLPMAGSIRFYDTWLFWGAAQCAACLILLLLLIREAAGRKKGWLLRLSAAIPMAAFLLDFTAAFFGWWQNGLVSQVVFVAFFAGVMVRGLWTIPWNILAAAKAKELETELQKSRIAIMMSQIKPHFIYNTLGSIEQLCRVQPEEAARLVHDFARYLRGSFHELDNNTPIPMSQEMEHVRCYVSIEKTRFPDITVAFDIQSEDFLLPALSVQPLVENAIKHGLMQLPPGRYCDGVFV